MRFLVKKIPEGTSKEYIAKFEVSTMTDTMTPEQRHRCMSHIHSKGTKPELKVRRWLWAHGYRYRLNVKSVPGKPDIVMRPYRTAIFVNGCFWHGHNVGIRATVATHGGKELQDFASAEREQEIVERDIQNSKCCKIPQTNRAFWVEKIRRNQARDEENYRVLQENGWQVIVVWECQLTATTIERTMRTVELMLNENMLSLYRKHTSIPYTYEEDRSLPMAAEGDPSEVYGLPKGTDEREKKPNTKKGA